MTDWNKAKVVDLRAELKRRGLPQTGLKPALVARLTAADSGDGSESEATVQGDGLKLNPSAATSPDTVSPTQPPSTNALSSIAPGPVPESSHRVAEIESEEVETSMVDTSNEPFPTNSTNTFDASQTPSQAEEDRSALPSVEPQEALDDRQKRKRRSQTPPPSVTYAARKRFRANDEAGTEVEDEDEDEDVKDNVLTTGADCVWVEKHTAVDATNRHATSEEIGASSVKSDPTIIDVTKEEVIIKSVGEGERMGVDLKSEPFSEGTQTAPEALEDSPSRTRDSRFKDLFTSPQARPTMEKSRSREAGLHDVGEPEPDRIISPAIHPATAALYIRDFMRPLNPAQLKEHLADLATPPGQNADLDIVVKFYLDPIRTHAFISFKNISAAARVRSSLHARIWPNERNRKALWVDFIPVEKVEEWIHQEESSNSGGRAMAKKWEVVYDNDEDRHVSATLRESSTLGGPGTGHLRRHSEQIPEGIRGEAQTPPLATQVALAPFTSRGIEGAPSGPRAEQNRGQIAVANLQTLDQLFRSTTAKPVLYWEPVSKAVANKRLDAMEDATSKGYSASHPPGGDINRYTFEDNTVLVDRGPEIFPGIRPPVDSRGPGYMRFQQRRGGPQVRRGFGGDRAYDSYRGDRRGSRDDRR